MDGRIGLALSILNSADGHEARAIDEAILALLGVDIDQLLALRTAGTGAA